MFSHIHNLTATHFEINPFYTNQKLDVLEEKGITPVISVKKATNSFALKITVNCTYKEASSSKIIVSYKGEKIGDLSVTTKDKDRPELIKFLAKMLKELDVFFDKEMPSLSALNQVEIDINEIADYTLNLLEKNGIY